MSENMGLQSFGDFSKLLAENYTLQQIGFSAEVSVGDINRFNSRVRLAQNFRGINLDGYSKDTVTGYDAFFQVFLTHSALERFLEINLLEIHNLEPLIISCDPDMIIADFFKDDLLYQFLHKRLNKSLKKKMADLNPGVDKLEQSKRSKNIVYISASIRHIFAHGHLCAHSNEIKPRNVHKVCISLSDFLLNFMDTEFTRKVEGARFRL